MQGVPSSEALRLAALRASWARDRPVRWRKLTWRWAAWFGSRWIFPVVAAVALGWIPASLHWATPLSSGELSPHEALHLSPSIGTEGAPGVPPPTPASPEPGLFLKPDNQLNSKEI